MSLLRVVPVRFREAAQFVTEHHRHHKRPPGCLFCLGVAEGENLVGVAIVGRPVARHLDDGRTAEVTRTATNGAQNACSMLYGAAWRAARAMGYERLITYTMDLEPGTSLRAAGWRVVASRPPRAGWSSPSRPRVDTSPVHVQRTLWEVS